MRLAKPRGTVRCVQRRLCTTRRRVVQVKAAGMVVQRLVCLLRMTICTRVVQVTRVHKQLVRLQRQVLKRIGVCDVMSHVRHGSCSSHCSRLVEVISWRHRTWRRHGVAVVKIRRRRPVTSWRRIR